MKPKFSLNKILAIALTAAVLCCVGLFIFIHVTKTKEPDITNELLEAKIEAVSELTTARLTYNGLLHYEEGDIPLLTKKSFFMIYCAEIEAGIDFSQVEISISDDNVELILPEADILDIYIDPDSIEFYDESIALFNWSDKKDAVDAISKAEADVQEKADIQQLVETAQAQTRTLLENLLTDLIGERTLVICYK